MKRIWGAYDIIGNINVCMKGAWEGEKKEAEIIADYFSSYWKHAESLMNSNKSKFEEFHRQVIQIMLKIKNKNSVLKLLRKIWLLSSMWLVAWCSWEDSRMMVIVAMYYQFCFLRIQVHFINYVPNRWNRRSQKSVVDELWITYHSE